MDIGALIDGITEVLRSLVATPPQAYLVVFAMAAIDVIFPIIPSEAFVLAAAVAAGTGALNVGLVALAAALGAFLGDNLAYLVGRSMGRPLMERMLGDRIDRLGWMETRLQRHGPSLIIVGRFVPGGRSLVAIGSGVIRMRWATFAAYDAIAVTVWSLQVVIPGYIGGSVFTEQPWLGFIVGAVISLAVVATIEGLRWLNRRRRGETIPTDMEDRVSLFLDRISERFSSPDAVEPEERPEGD